MSAEPHRWSLPTADLPKVSTIDAKLEAGIRPINGTLDGSAFDEDVKPGDLVWLRSDDLALSLLARVTKVVVHVEVDPDSAERYEPIT